MKFPCPHCSGEIEVAVNRVHRAARGGGQTPPPLLDVAWLALEYETKSADQIAAEIGSNPKTVLKWLKKHGITVRAAGLASTSRYADSRDRRAADFIRALQDWSRENDGLTPTQADWATSRPLGAPSERAARNLFGGWNKALRAAGLSTRKRGEHLSSGAATAAGRRPGRNRQMVTGRGLSDSLPGTVKHFKEAA